MAKTEDEQVVEQKEQAPKTKKRSEPMSADLLVFIFVAAVLGYLGYSSWQAFIPPTPEEITAQASPTPSVPELKLNQENKRNAPPIEIDEEDIGKENPFE